MRTRIPLALLLGVASCRTRPAEVETQGADKPAVVPTAETRSSSGDAAGDVGLLFECKITEQPWWGPVRITAKTDGTCEAVFNEAPPTWRPMTAEETIQLKLTPEDREDFEQLLGHARPAVQTSLRRRGFETWHSFRGILQHRNTPRVEGVLRWTEQGTACGLLLAEEGGPAALTHWISRLMNQANCLRHLRRGEDTGWVCFFLPGAVPGPHEVLEVSAFREPFEHLLETGQGELETTVGALWYLVTPDEWRALIDRQLRNEDDAKVDAVVSALLAWNAPLEMEKHDPDATVRGAARAARLRLAKGQSGR